MNDMFAFEKADWELLLEGLRPGQSVSALRLLHALEKESDDGVAEALEALLEKGVTLELATLPQTEAGEDMQKRLLLEAQLVQQGLDHRMLSEGDPLRLYLQELPPVCTPQALEELMARQLAGQKAAAEQLLSGQLGRVLLLAKPLAGRGVLLLDLIQEGSLGLWQGIMSYREGDVQAHLDRYITEYMAHAVFQQARQNGVAQRLRQAMEDYSAADRALLTRLGRNATLEELAAHMGISPEQAEQVEEVLRTAQLLAQAHRQPEPEPEEEQQAVEDTAYFQSRQRVQELLSTLSGQEARVLTLRFGLEGGLPLQSAAVAEKLGLTLEQVTKLEEQALQKLRKQ